MAKDTKRWHPHFLAYMEFIAGHPNYTGLPIERKKDGSLQWLATAKTKIGQARMAWARHKALSLGLSLEAGFYADVMLAIHPTKKKVCQICGKEMSLYYHYPNALFLKSLNTTFKCNFTDCDHIADIWDTLISEDVPKEAIATFLITKGNLLLNATTASKDELINALESVCRHGEKHCLGPGAMSNFPDRYDGFHSYNRCCRGKQDKGRSKDNLKSYTKDRRAYEYWSDGNIHAANQFMGSTFFKGTSADHIGPISLGFVHDPHYLQPMTSSDNSSKRDRLQIVDIEKIIETEKRTGVCPISWHSKIIWKYIRSHYKQFPYKVPTTYRDALKQNMSNFMHILRYIIDNCPTHGKTFLIKSFLEPQYDNFNYSYKFDAIGNILSKRKRHHTARNEKEPERYMRIALQSVIDYSTKGNRNNTNDLSADEIKALDKICRNIETDSSVSSNKQQLISFVESIEMRIISKI